jgi:hypothetical protein
MVHFLPCHTWGELLTVSTAQQRVARRAATVVLRHTLDANQVGVRFTSLIPELNLTGVSVGRCVVMQPNLTCIFSDEPEVRDASPVEFAPRSSPSSLVRHEERGSCECGLQISRITRTAQLLHFQEPHFALRDGCALPKHHSGRSVGFRWCGAAIEPAGWCRCLG